MRQDITKPSILPGFMELLPSDQIIFNKMIDTIRRNYEKCGFIPLDTPMIEKSEVLLAKGGGETEKQIYRFQKGDSDLSLRFDLTVPLARYVAQYYPSLTFPFRRYHISKVFRGERNQKGRFREFYQCDIDIVGNGKLSIINDAEIPSVIYSTFKDLGFDAFTIRINNRKILNGFFNELGATNKVDILRTLDKIDKIGQSEVESELGNLGMDKEIIRKIMEFIQIKGTNDEKISALKALNIENSLFVEGLEELGKVIQYIRYFNVPEKNFQIDVTIARGLDYYTGTVYETILDDYPGIGSVCSGGRYDNLAEYYTEQKLPGVGISIGLTRLFYQLREAQIINTKGVSTLSEVLVVPMGEYVGESIDIAHKLRDKGIIAEVYYEEAKLSKKLTYANKLGISYVIIIGENEVTNSRFTLKDMVTGEQITQELNELIEHVISKRNQ